jgi:chorismate lyase
LPAKSFLYARSPVWKSYHPGIHHRLPVELLSWLEETGSLTKRLRQIYGGDFGVKVLFNRWKPAYIDECRLLGLDPACYQLIREVQLHSNGVPLVLARTVLPSATIRIARRNLSHLGNRPLGEVLFAYPDLQLRDRQFSSAPSNIWSQKLQDKQALETPIWGRRTVYAIHNQPLLVAEFFLPALFAGQ